MLFLVAPTFFDSGGWEVACVVTEGTSLTKAQVHVVHGVLVKLNLV
jgi:hypothetical protein